MTTVNQNYICLTLMETSDSKLIIYLLGASVFYRKIRGRLMLIHNV